MNFDFVACYRDFSATKMKPIRLPTEKIFWSAGMKTKLSWKAWLCIIVGSAVILAFLVALFLLMLLGLFGTTWL